MSATKTIITQTTIYRDNSSSQGYSSFTKRSIRQSVSTREHNSPSFQELVKRIQEPANTDMPNEVEQPLSFDDVIDHDTQQPIGSVTVKDTKDRHYVNFLA